ncbi:E3 ubiquitin-protein ligase TRIM62-like [Patiria miniata]|uniref:Tripartite motif-containing protein 3-like n=1 Tax=Patiria miniata TaxID=46514 RepID=A0A914AFU7_PATMI|nr:E3 ubiquitin-protein ligase TRIM62-like [Patiria miniata]
MATALKTISSLECDICADRYKQPKILDCQHSFCKDCLEQYYTSRHGGQPKIPCPLCRRETVLPKRRIQGLKTNFHLMGIVEEVSLQEKVARSVEQTSSDQSKCQKHNGEVKWFYCETCEELICRACTVIDHCKPEHHYIDSGEASRKYKQSLKEMFPNVTTGIKILQKALATSSQAKQKFTQNVTKTVKAVKDKADKMRAEITTQETKMIEEIKQLQQKRNKTYDEHQSTLTMMLESKKHSLGTSQDIITTASDSDFLSLYPIISKDLKSLKSQNPPQIDPKLSYLSFTLGQRIGDINLGKLEVEAVKWEMCREFGKEGSGPGKFHGARDVTATQPGEIAVADYYNNRVVICSNEGQHKGTIPVQSKFLSCTSIHNPEQRLFVLEVGSKYVKVFNMKDNTLVTQFPTVPKHQVNKTKMNLSRLAVTKDSILVGNTYKMVWTEHKPTDGEILRTIPVQTPPYYLAVDDKTDRVVVSGGDTKKVDIADSKGRTNVTIRPTINGEPVGYCMGVCCDSSGIFLAVDQGGLGTNGHIHHYDLDGKFLDCLAQGLRAPCGITFTSNGELAVADNFSIKMYHKV